MLANLTNYKKMAVMIFLGSALFLSQSIAAVNPNDKSKTTTSEAKYLGQKFTLDNLKIEFKYENFDLKTIYIENTASFPVIINVFENDYVLGTNESIEIPPHKDLNQMVLAQERYTHYHNIDTIGDDTLKLRYRTYYYFRLRPHCVQNKTDTQFECE